MFDLGISERLKKLITGQDATTPKNTLLYKNTTTSPMASWPTGNSKDLSNVKNNGKVAGVSTSYPSPSIQKSPTGNSIGKATSSMISSDPYKDAIKSSKKQKEEQEKLLKKQEKSYNSYYDFVTNDIKSRLPQAESEKASAIESINAELENLLTKGNISKEDASSYYANTKEDVTKAHEETNKELARLFGARNATDSSYFMEKLQQSGTAFEKTLANLGSEESRKLAEIDADMTYYQKQAIDKKAEIEKAYNETIRAINSDLTKTSFEKANAIQNLESEYQSKVASIDDRILSYGVQQQEFRSNVMKWSYDESYKASTTASADATFDALKASVGRDGKADPELYARLRSSAKISADQFDKKYGYLLSGNEQTNLGLTKSSNYAPEIQKIMDGLGVDESTATKMLQNELGVY